MKKISLFCIFAICLSSVMKGYDLRKMEISFHGGLANPVGKFSTAGFSSFDRSSGKLSYNGAKSGFDYGLALSFFPSDYFGAIILFNGASYKFNSNTFSGTINDTKQWETVYSDKWSAFMANAGATFRYPLLDKLQITSRATIGYAHLMSPYYKAQANERRVVWTKEIHSKSAPAFGMGFGIGFKWLLSPGFHLNLMGDYFTATPFKLKNIESVLSTQTTNSLGSSEPTIVEVEKASYNTIQKFSSLNLSLGISFAF